MDRILIILKKENGSRASSAPVLGLNTIIFKHVLWYMQQTQVSVYRTIDPLVKSLFCIGSSNIYACRQMFVSVSFFHLHIIFHGQFSSKFIHTQQKLSCLITLTNSCLLNNETLDQMVSNKMSWKDNFPVQCCKVPEKTALIAVNTIVLSF